MNFFKFLLLIVTINFCYAFNTDISIKDKTPNKRIKKIETNYLDSLKKAKEKIYDLNQKNQTLEKKVERLAKDSSKKNDLKNDPKNSNFLSYITSVIKDYYFIYLFLSFILLAIIIIMYEKIKENEKETKILIEKYKILKNIRTPVNDTDNTSTKKIQPAKVNENYSGPITSQNNNYKKNDNSKDWMILSASSIGKSHIKNNIKCQDNHSVYNLKSEGWGIAISCDGAGSAENSELGSAFISKNLFEVLENKLFSYSISNALPDENAWNKICIDSLKESRSLLNEYATINKLPFSSLACTVIVVVFTPIGLLSGHIGDGRAGFLNSTGEWNSLIIPHKGEESNQTIFITSDVWYNTEDFRMNDIPVPETKVFNGNYSAFTLMSDGCETHSFDCSKLDTNTNKWVDPNIPSIKFFEPLIKQINLMVQNKVPNEQINSNWIKFVESGTEGLKNESDDKTLIIGVVI